MLSGCPFLGGKRAASESGAPTTGSKCPFGFTAKKAPTASAAVVAETPTSPASDTQPASDTSSGKSAPAATCPYGFSSAASAGPQLSQLHCPLCKQWFHQPVICAPCQHKFCAFCISAFRDCPVCGHDVECKEPDQETQGLVEKLLDAHLAVARQQEDAGVSGSGLGPSDPSSPASATGPLPSLPPLMPGAGPSTSASLLLHLGLQALRSGNPVAAIHRLEICKTELLHSCEDKETASKTEAATSSSPAQPASAATATPAAATNTDAAASPLTQLLDTWAPDSASMSEGLTIQLPAGCGDVGRPVQLAVPAALAPSAACPIAVVFGSQGDAAKQLGAYGAAAALHAAGARCLQGAAAAGDEEAAHALTVSVNKLGDVCYLNQDLSGAVRAYRAALSLRRQRLTAALGQSRDSVSPPQRATQQCDDSRDVNTWELEDMTMSALPQALDCAASLIKVADACLAHSDTPAARQAANSAHSVLAACRRVLGSGPAPTPSGQEETSDATVTIHTAHTAMHAARCDQLTQVLAGLRLSEPQAAGER